MSLHRPEQSGADIQVAVHTAMLPSGEEPREAVVSTRNYTEFRGAVIVVLPDNASRNADRRQVLTVKFSGCPMAACTDVDVLAQVSPADITTRYAAWLAPDDTGVVTFDIGGASTDAADLKLSVDGHPDIACRDEKRGEPVPTQWLDEREGTFVRIAPSPGINVTVMSPCPARAESTGTETTTTVRNETMSLLAPARDRSLRGANLMLL